MAGPLWRFCIGYFAKVAELVDALDLGSSVARRESSSLSFRTTLFIVLSDTHLIVHSYVYTAVEPCRSCLGRIGQQDDLERIWHAGIH